MPSQLRVLDSLSATYAPVNEDLALRSPGTIWVLDGATGLGAASFTGEASDAAWLTSTARSVLAAAASDARPLEESLRRAIVHVRHAFETVASHLPEQRYEWPSAAVVGVKLDGDELVGIALGDCKLVFGHEDGRPPVVLGGGALEELDGDVIERMAALQRDRGLTLVEARTALEGRIRANRALMNTPGGYWNLSCEVGAVDHVARVGVPSARGVGLLASDGFYSLVDTLDRYDDAGLLRAARERGLAPLLVELREAELADPEGRAHPRLKAHDDATAVLFEVVAPHAARVADGA